jgi:alpha/beta superfamily hydrolase
MPDIIINGPQGRIEGKYTHSKLRSPNVALVLHPHPLHGGTMNNKVVYNIYKTFADNDFSGMRFNFRGVGKSSGEFDNGIGEMLDATTALDWLQMQNPEAHSFWISGFSFGAWIALQLVMRRPEIVGFIASSPPVNKYDFSFLSPCPASGLILQGDMDSVVSEDSVSRLVEKLSKQRGVTIDYQVLNGADHYFRNNLEELSKVINEYIGERLSNGVGIVKKAKTDRRRRQSKQTADN